MLSSKSFTDSYDGFMRCFYSCFYSSVSWPACFPVQTPISSHTPDKAKAPNSSSQTVQLQGLMFGLPGNIILAIYIPVIISYMYSYNQLNFFISNFFYSSLESKPKSKFPADPFVVENCRCCFLLFLHCIIIWKFHLKIFTEVVQSSLTIPTLKIFSPHTFA